MSAISFEIEKRMAGTRARAGVLTTPHGVIKTPSFVPVGTRASVKGLLPRDLKEIGAQVVLANTYHLYLSPGEQLIAQAGGFGKFMDWNGPTITDSGGFQVFSLGAGFGKPVSKLFKGEVETKEEQLAVYDEGVASQHGRLAVIDDEGVTFTSYRDGSLHRFTPERSIEIQHALGADIFFAFDECTALDETYEYQKEAMYRTHRWADRSLKAHRHNIEAAKKQAIFGIVQGGPYDDLRTESAREIAAMGFDGIGIGGSFTKESIPSMLETVGKELPEELPKHFLGIGEPADILAGIAGGMDLFDCVAATRMGRHGSIYTRQGPIHLTGEKYRADFSPLDPETVIPGTENFTRAYVAHLLHNKEMLGGILCSLHNVGFIIKLVEGARQAILEDRFEEYRASFERDYYKR